MKLVIKESTIRRMISEAPFGDSPKDLIDFAKAYRDLGWAVHEQLDAFLAGDAHAIHPGAVSMIQDALGGFNSHLDQMLNLANPEEEFEDDMPPGLEFGYQE